MDPTTLGSTPYFYTTLKYVIGAAFHLCLELTSRQHNLKARGSGSPYEFRWVDGPLTYSAVQSLLSYLLGQ